MSKSKKYQVLSPDGFSIDFNILYYRSLKQAKESLNNWIDRYKIQGYYSSSKFGRIDLIDLKDYCYLIES